MTQPPDMRLSIQNLLHICENRPLPPEVEVERSRLPDFGDALVQVWQERTHLLSADERAAVQLLIDRPETDSFFDYVWVLVHLLDLNSRTWREELSPGNADYLEMPPRLFSEVEARPANKTVDVRRRIARLARWAPLPATELLTTADLLCLDADQRNAYEAAAKRKLSPQEVEALLPLADRPWSDDLYGLAQSHLILLEESDPGWQAELAELPTPSAGFQELIQRWDAAGRPVSETYHPKRVQKRRRRAAKQA